MLTFVEKLREQYNQAKLLSGRTKSPEGEYLFITFIHLSEKLIQKGIGKPKRGVSFLDFKVPRKSKTEEDPSTYIHLLTWRFEWKKSKSKSFFQ